MATDSPHLLLRLVRRPRAAPLRLPTFTVNAGPNEEREIAAAEVAGQIGPETVIIRRFGHLSVDELASLP